MSDGVIEDFCYHRLRMQLILNHCENRYVPYDGEFLVHMVIVDGVGAINDGTGTVDTSVCASVVTANDIPEDVQDPVCRQAFPPRKQSAVGVLDDRVYASGGYYEQSVIGSDVWYRGGCHSLRWLLQIFEVAFAASSCRAAVRLGLVAQMKASLSCFHR